MLPRLLLSARSRPIGAVDPSCADGARIGIVVPVLNERHRLGPCLEGLTRQGPEVAEILVVDGGSTDGTPGLVASYRDRDDRVRLVDASPVPDDWNGKAWGLQVGLEAATREATWLLTIDADVRPAPALARSLVAHARAERVAALSAATLQQLSGAAEALLHPSFLATLVYRLGGPGRVARRVGEAQANGQCMLFRRDILEACGGFRAAKASRCEDVTMARQLTAVGHRVGFYETDRLVSVKMYEDWREAWQNWPRSLPLFDQFDRRASVLGLLEVTFVQALPVPLLALLVARRREPWPALAVNTVLTAIRIGVLVGTARAYAGRPWTYWLSPLADVPVLTQIWLSLVKRRHVWRGRALVPRAP